MSLLGDVADHPLDGDDLARLVRASARAASRPRSSRRPCGASGTGRLGAVALHDLLRGVRDDRGVLRVEKLEEDLRVAAELLRRVAGHRQDRRADVVERPGGGDGPAEDHVGRALGEQPEPLLAVAQRSIHPALLGDVAARDQDAADRGVVEEVLAGGLEQPPRAVRMPRAELHRRDGPRRRQALGECLREGLDVVRVDVLEAAPADVLVRPVAEHPRERVVHVPDDPSASTIITMSNSCAAMLRNRCSLAWRASSAACCLLTPRPGPDRPLPASSGSRTPSSRSTSSPLLLPARDVATGGPPGSGSTSSPRSSGWVCVSQNVGSA